MVSAFGSPLESIPQTLLTNSPTSRRLRIDPSGLFKWKRVQVGNKRLPHHVHKMRLLVCEQRLSQRPRLAAFTRVKGPGNKNTCPLGTIAQLASVQTREERASCMNIIYSDRHSFYLKISFRNIQFFGGVACSTYHTPIDLVTERRTNFWRAPNITHPQFLVPKLMLHARYIHDAAFHWQ